MDFYRQHDDEDEGPRPWLEGILPIRRAPWTIVLPDLSPEAPPAALTADGPTADDQLIKRLIWLLDYEGIFCSPPEALDDLLYTEMKMATGDVVREQVLGWDDIYTDEELERLETASRLYVTLRVPWGGLDDSLLNALARAILHARATRDL